MTDTFIKLHGDIKIYNIHVYDSNGVDKHIHRYHLLYNANCKFFHESPAAKYGYDNIEELYKLGLRQQLTQDDVDRILVPLPPEQKKVPFKVDAKMIDSKQK